LSNRQHIDFGIDLIRRLGHKEIGIFGFAFKAGTDDLRESPMVELIEHLLGKGYRLKIFDRSVNVAYLRGANRRLLMEKIPHITDLMVDRPSDLFEHGKAIVIGNAARELAEISSDYWAGKDVVDLADALDKQMIPFLASYTGPGWH
jgi:GDP-mannose 6-dehydrogenase